MKTLIDGIFYINYWRFRNSSPNSIEKIEVFRASLAITAPSAVYFLLFLGICEICGSNIFEDIRKSIFFSFYAIVNVLGLIYYFYKYKKIIIEHNKYNNRKYKSITGLFYALFVLSTIIGVTLLYISSIK